MLPIMQAAGAVEGLASILRNGLDDVKKDAALATKAAEKSSTEGHWKPFQDAGKLQEPTMALQRRDSSQRLFWNHFTTLQKMAKMNTQGTQSESQ